MILEAWRASPGRSNVEIFMNSPLMLSDRDKDLLGVVNRVDAMGVLAVWTARGRDLVPHLTEQTTEIRGFQILVEALRLWERYEGEHPEHAGRTGDFFLLVEQAFARAVGSRDKKWPLPGARRVRARANEKPYISVANPDWHLLDSQKANGIWGLYRGAGVRAGLLLDPPRLSDRTHEHAARHVAISQRSVRDLFGLVSRAMERESEPLPTQGSSPLQRELCQIFDTVPLKDHLHEMLIENHALNSALAGRLIPARHLNHRTFFQAASRELVEHHEAICQVIRCENLLAVVESIFFWLCANANKGTTLPALADELEVDLDALEQARADFGRSGAYSGRTAADRQALFHGQLKTSNHLELARSVLSIHSKVSKERGRAAWVRIEGDKLCSDMDVHPPSANEFQVGVAWRNDYYLRPLRSIALQLNTARP